MACYRLSEQGAVMSEITTFRVPFLKGEGKSIRFESGHTFVFVPKPGDVFNISTWVKTGSLHEDDVNSGVSHFLEHLMFKGTDRFQPGEFDREMESMGAVINAATWKDFTFYYITGPQGEGGQNFEMALDMHADMLLMSTLPDSEIGSPYNPDDPNYAGEKRERSVVIEEIGMREDMPWTKVYNAMNHMMYPDGHPYQRDVIGTRQIIGHISRSDIEQYYHRWYSAPNMTTIVVGDFDWEQLVEKIPQYFDFSKAIRNEPPGQTIDTADLSTHGKQLAKINGEYQTHFFMMGFHAPAVKNIEESIALDVASYVLGEGRSSRLTQSLLEKPTTPNFNAISCGQSSFKLGNVFFVQGNFLSPDVENSLSEVQAEIDKMLHSEPITEAEFKRAIKNLKVDFAETSETASGIAETIGESLTVAGDLSHYTNYLTILEKLDRSQVQSVAQRYLNSDRMYTSVLVPERHG